MKKLCVFIVTMVCLLGVCACKARSSEQETTHVNRGSEGQKLISESNPLVCDDMEVWRQPDREFFMMRIGSDYIEIPHECNFVYLTGSSQYPAMEDGQIVRVVADVEIAYGGIAGYLGNLFIKEIKSVEPVDYRYVIDRLEVPDAMEQEFEFDERMLAYEAEDQVSGKKGPALIILSRNYVYEYVDGTCVEKEKYGEKDPSDYMMIFTGRTPPKLRMCEYSLGIDVMEACCIRVENGTDDEAFVFDYSYFVEKEENGTWQEYTSDFFEGHTAGDRATYLLSPNHDALFAIDFSGYPSGRYRMTLQLTSDVDGSVETVQTEFDVKND